MEVVCLEKILLTSRIFTNIKEALDYAYNYLIAAAKNTPLQNRMLQEANRLKRVMDQLITQHQKKTSNKTAREQS